MFESLFQESICIRIFQTDVACTFQNGVYIENFKILPLIRNTQVRFLIMANSMAYHVRSAKTKFCYIHLIVGFRVGTVTNFCKLHSYEMLSIVLFEGDRKPTKQQPTIYSKLTIPVYFMVK